ncbi:MAG: hypothetical protein WCP38_03225 [Chloroflexota bacterium]
MNLPDKIISIEEIGEEETIDIAVSDDNLFFANNILTHNCGYGQVMPALETTSESMGLAHTVDCQMPIWTEEEDFDLGVIHLGITKNRFGPRECSTILQIDYPTLSLTDPDEVSKAYSPPVPNIPGSLKNKKPTDTSLNNTLDLIEKLGED